MKGTDTLTPSEVRDLFNFFIKYGPQTLRRIKPDNLKILELDRKNQKVLIKIRIFLFEVTSNSIKHITENYQLE